MKSIKLAAIAALTLSAFSAMAGEIENSTVYGYNTDNRATGTYAYAYQGVGVATGDSKIQNSFIEGGYARNAATGYGSYATQEIGAA